MIKNKDFIADKSMIRSELELSPLSFYPCGSRFFGHFKEDSDYDYFIEKESDYRQKLNKLGFLKSDRTPEYGELDINTVEIYYSYKHDIKRQVMVVLSAENREQIQKKIIREKITPPKGDTTWWNNQYQEL